MPGVKLEGEELRVFLVNNWMTHDAIWYGEAASRFGMAEASPMNLRVCRSLGKIEFKRFLKATGASRPDGMRALREMFDQAWRVFVPPAFDGEVDFRADDTMVMKNAECFAHKGMVRAGLIGEYECGIFERIEGWFDAMGLDYTRTPDLSRCLKYKGEECVVTIQFRFEEKEDPIR
jgi:hypothetical protein